MHVGIGVVVVAAVGVGDVVVAAAKLVVAADFESDKAIGQRT